MVVVRFGRLGLRLVEPARLRHADAVRDFVAVNSWPGAGSAAPTATRAASADSAATPQKTRLPGKRQQVQSAGQVAFAAPPRAVARRGGTSAGTSRPARARRLAQTNGSVHDGKRPSLQNGSPARPPAGCESRRGAGRRRPRRFRRRPRAAAGRRSRCRTPRGASAPGP